MKTIFAALSLLALSAAPALAQGAPDPAAGKALWEGNNTQCKFCHGRLGEGAFGPDLAGRGLSPSQFTQAVRKPWGIMPTFVDTQISDADLNNLAAYFASLPKVAAPGDWRFATKVSDPHGQQVFHEVGCAQCHGPTFDMPRGTLGGLNADFEQFRKLVYTHTTVMRDVDEELAAGNPLPPAGPPGGGANRAPPPLRMGNFSTTRVTEAELKDIYDWAHGDIGFRPLLQGRLSPGTTGPTGVTYTVSIANNGLKGKGLTATGMTVDMVIPSVATVVATTGDGYKGVHADAAAKGNVAEWTIPRMAPKEAKTFTITLSKAGSGQDDLHGMIRWATPKPKSGPNLDVQNIGPPPGAGGGAGARGG